MFQELEQEEVIDGNQVGEQIKKRGAQELGLTAKAEIEVECTAHRTKCK